MAIQISTYKAAADIEFLQMQDQGLILRFSDYPEARDLTTENDDITVYTTDGVEFPGCYVYEKNDEMVFVGVC